MTGLATHIALVSESAKITFDDVSSVAAAVAKQVARDFTPAWGVSATVQAFATLESIPSDYVQVILVDNDNMPGAAGYHTDSHGQPLALVQVEGEWPLTVSHEILELLADGQGNRIVTADIPPQASMMRGIVPATALRVDYLVEVCDPVEDAEYSYQINGIPVSDFVLPNYYSSAESANPADFIGHIAPRAIEEGGYVSFRDPATGIWYQVFNDDGKLSAHVVSVTNGSVSSLRERMDKAARLKRMAGPQVNRRIWRCLNTYPAGRRERAESVRKFICEGKWS